MEGEDTRLYPESELKTEHFTNRAAMLGQHRTATHAMAGLLDRPSTLTRMGINESAPDALWQAMHSQGRMWAMESPIPTFRFHTLEGPSTKLQRGLFLSLFPRRDGKQWVAL